MDSIFPFNRMKTVLNVRNLCQLLPVSCIKLLLFKHIQLFKYSFFVLFMIHISFSSAEVHIIPEDTSTFFPQE